MFINNNDIRNNTDTEVAQALLEVIVEARRRGLLRKSYEHVAPMMAMSAVKQAAFKAAGQPAKNSKQHQGTWTPEVQAALDRGDVLDAGAVLSEGAQQ